MNQFRPKVHVTYIDYHPDRIQPYTVWIKGRVIWFAYTRPEAELKLDRAQK